MKKNKMSNSKVKIIEEQTNKTTSLPGKRHIMPIKFVLAPRFKFLFLFFPYFGGDLEETMEE